MCHSHICPLEDARGRCTHRRPGPRPCAVEDQIADIIARRPRTDMLCPLCLGEGLSDAYLAQASGETLVCERCARVRPAGEWLEAYALLTDGFLDARDALAAELAGVKAGNMALRRACDRALDRARATARELDEACREREKG